MLLNRHRIAKLIELSELERRLAGPERALREADVALLVKAAYDDASDAARAAFMARVQALPVTDWPWSAVQVKVVRSGVVTGPGGRVTMGASTPFALAVPPALVLIRGEAESADAEPGDRLPAAGTPEAAGWEPLHRALAAWDTTAIAAWIGPQGWFNPGAAASPAEGEMGPDGGHTAPSPARAWRGPGMIAIGATVASTLGVVLFSLQRRRAPAQETP